MGSSGILDAICNVRMDELAEVEELVDDLARQLAVATGVRDALRGGHASAASVAPESPPSKPPAKAKRNGKPRGKSRKMAVSVTDKTRRVAEVLLERGALTRDQIAEELGWPVRAVGMTIGRSKQHFRVQPDGTVLVSDKLAEMLEQ